jgi:uncharacterized protein YndB with AHSA1/START domain
MTTPQRRSIPASKKIRIERTFQASPQEVWEMWTTREGIESWWGPEGFRVEVRTLELRPGGRLDYAMIAASPEMLAFMKKEGMSGAHETHATIDEVVPPRRLVFTHHTDFIPGIAPYDATAVVELEATAQGTKLVLTLDPMHDETWTQRAVMGWESELGKLAKLLER